MAYQVKNVDFPNVRADDMEWIWHESSAFNKFLDFGWMNDPCRFCSECEKDLAGCRCQAFLLTEDA
jgi:pyrroloquinoline quinone biosynthesis protein E